MEQLTTVLGVLGAYFAIVLVLAVSVETVLEPFTWFKGLQKKVSPDDVLNDIKGCLHPIADMGTRAAAIMNGIGQRIFLLLIILAASISACVPNSAINNTTPGNSIKGARSASCANPLYPVIQGATWTYASTGSPAGPFLFTDTITEARMDGFTLASQFTDLTLTQEWACKPEGLLALQLGGGHAAGISTQGLSAQFETFNITGLTLPVNIQNTQQWAYSLMISGDIAMPDNQTSQADGSLSSAFQVLGAEAISVPAGAFDAIKVQVNSEYTLNTSFQGFPMPLNFSSTTIMWYAPYVGWVKSIENSDFGGTPYSSTIELQSYSLP